MISIFRDCGWVRYRRVDVKMVNLMGDKSRIGYRNLLREYLNNQEEIIVQNEKSELVRGVLKFGYLDSKWNFNDLKSPDHVSNTKGIPGYFVVNQNQLMQIPLCKIESYDVCRNGKTPLVELNINNNLPPRGQRNHLRWNN